MGLILYITAAITFAATTSSPPTNQVDLVQVIKSKHQLLLLSKGKILRQYKIALGSNPLGHKQEQGDGKTPEGRYTLDYKNKNSAFYKSIHVSYPNAQDVLSARQRQIDPGGQIMIHGQKNGFGWLSWITQNFDWTQGCIALSNQNMDEVWGLVDAHTPIEILP